MKKRRQKLEELSRNGGNIEYFGLRKGQVVRVRNRGPGVVEGDPPQGSGVYVMFLDGRPHLVSGEDIVEATEPR